MAQKKSSVNSHTTISDGKIEKLLHEDRRTAVDFLVMEKKRLRGVPSTTLYNSHNREIITLNGGLVGVMDKKASKLDMALQVEIEALIYF